MKINKKKGFTLVELLAVIVILAIILVIAVPQIMTTIKDTTKASLESSAKMVAAQVEKEYTVAQTLGKEFGDTGSCMKDWAGLNDVDYESCTYEITSNGKAKITLVGKGKFKNLSVCGGTRSGATATEEGCEDNSGVSYITELLAQESTLNNGIFVDNTDDKNIRYHGENPNNYVYFNCKDTYNGKSYGSDGYDYALACETWRIIGIFDVKTNISDTIGTKRIKIVRDAFTDSDGNELKMSWDSSSENINNGEGINQWGTSGSYEGADLMNLLNGYYIGESTVCNYCDGYNQETCENNCFDDITQLSNNARDMIENAVWSTRAINFAQLPERTSEEFYNFEKTSELTGKECSATNSDRSENIRCNDTVIRTTEWEGKVGLIYSSDWGYASADEDCEDITNSYGTCRQNNWLYRNEDYWFITQFSNENDANSILTQNGGHMPTGFYNSILPSVYLKSNIQIIGGNGGTEPFILK